MLLWFLSSFPAPPPGATEPAINYSLAGRLGHLLQYVFAPLGFNWQICIALIPGLAAREVAVSSLATVYALSGNEAGLPAIVAAQWSLATALSLLVWYVYAPMCISTLATIRRETNSWRYVWITAGYLFGLAYLASLPDLSDREGDRMKIVRDRAGADHRARRRMERVVRSRRLLPTASRRVQARVATWVERSAHAAWLRRIGHAMQPVQTASGGCGTSGCSTAARARRRRRRRVEAQPLVFTPRIKP